MLHTFMHIIALSCCSYILYFSTDARFIKNPVALQFWDFSILDNITVHGYASLSFHSANIKSELVTKLKEVRGEWGMYTNANASTKGFVSLTGQFALTLCLVSDVLLTKNDISEAWR